MHHAAAGDGLNRVVPVCLIAEAKQEARFHDLTGSGGIGFHTLRFIRHVRFGTELVNGVEQHVGPQVFHAAAFIKKDLQAEGISWITGPGGRGGRLSGSRSGVARALSAGLNLIDQSINFL